MGVSIFPDTDYMHSISFTLTLKNTKAVKEQTMLKAITQRVDIYRNSLHDTNKQIKSIMQLFDEVCKVPVSTVLTLKFQLKSGSLSFFFFYTFWLTIILDTGEAQYIIKVVHVSQSNNSERTRWQCRAKTKQDKTE